MVQLCDSDVRRELVMARAVAARTCVARPMTGSRVRLGFEAQVRGEEQHHCGNDTVENNGVGYR